MKTLDKQIESTQRTLEAVQERLKRLKRQKAQRKLKADYEAVKAENIRLVDGIGKLRNNLSNEAKWSADGKDGNKINLVSLEYVQANLKKLLVGE